MLQMVREFTRDSVDNIKYKVALLEQLWVGGDSGGCFTTLAAYELAEEGINWWFRWTLDSCGQRCTDHIYLESDKITCVWLSYPDALQTEPQPSEPKFDSSHQTRLESQILGDCSSSPAGRWVNNTSIFDTTLTPLLSDGGCFHPMVNTKFDSSQTMNKIGKAKNQVWCSSWWVTYI